MGFDCERVAEAAGQRGEMRERLHGRGLGAVRAWTYFGLVPAVSDTSDDFALEPWLTKRELAATLKVSVRTVERLRLPAMRVGGQNRYRLSEAESFLRQPETSGTVVSIR